MSDFEEIGAIINKYASTSDASTSLDFCRQKRGVENPYLLAAKEICSISDRNNTSKMLIKSFCDFSPYEKNPGELDIFYDFYVTGLSANRLIEKYDDVFIRSSGVDIENHRRQLFKIIERVNRSFAIFLSDAAAFVFSIDGITPESLPCNGIKANMRSSCPKCYFTDICK